MKKVLSFLLTTAMLLTLPACGGDGAASAPQSESEVGSATSVSSAFTPDRNVTVFAPYSVGGGVDTWGRTITALLGQTGIADVNWVYENVNGGTGQVGLGTVVSQYTGNENVLIPTASNYLMTPHIQGKEYSYRDLTMVAQLVVDYRCFVTSSESGFQSMEDIINEGKNRELVGAISGVGGIGHVALEMLKSEADISLRCVPFDGTEDSVAVLGNQVDIGNLSISEALPYIQSGDMVALAITAPERSEAIPDVPTCAELGYDIDLKSGRGFAMPAGVSQEARDYWIEKLEALLETEEFDEYLETSQSTVAFLAGDDYTAELDAEYALMEEVFIELGLAG